MSTVDEEPLIPETWLGRDDMGEIQVGDVIKSTYQGLTVFGVAAHTTDGSWFTEQGGLLVPAADWARWQLLDRPDVLVAAAERTIIVAQLDGLDYTLQGLAGEWLDMNTGEAFWKPGDPALSLGKWRVVSGSVSRA